MRINASNFNEMFGQRLKEVRKCLSLTQTEMAERLGMSLKGYQGNERAVAAPSALLVKGLSDSGISPLWILTGKGNMFLDSTSKSFYSEAEVSEANAKYTVSSFNTILDALVERGVSDNKVDSLRKSFEESAINNTEAFNNFIEELSEPFNSFYFISVINPEDETALKAILVGESPYEFHPIRRSWVEDRKLVANALVAVFPGDDAMTPTINYGELAVVYKHAGLGKNGLYAFELGNQIIIRRVEKRIGGFTLITDSDRYSNEVLSDEEALKLSVIGRVVRIDSYSE